MKTLITLCFIALHVFAGRNFDKTAVSISDNEKTYELSAVYPAGRTREVLSYMDKNLDVSTSLRNTETDAEMTLDNKYTFYMKSHPGELKLRFDKRKNTRDAYIKFKKMCEGIKDMLNHKS